MRIVEPYARMIGKDSGMVTEIDELGNQQPIFDDVEGLAMLRRIELFARVSHRSEDKQTLDSWERFIRSVVLQHGDWSVVEHESVSVEMLVDRGITHEIVRHRIGSYTQESTRFVNPIKKDGECQFIIPWDDIRGIETAYSIWKQAVDVAEQYYTKMLEAGCAPQIARSVLPNALASKIIVTYNLRSWRHFFIMRTSAQTHPQMRQVTIPLLKEFQEKIPILFEDIIPMRQQAEAMAAVR